MSLKDLFGTMKNEGYILKRLDQYLLKQVELDNDRRWDINSPSMASQCSRAIYYSRNGYSRDGDAVSPRLQRIFDNGTHVHIRLQEYLLGEGILLMDEVPVYNRHYQVQGHADGLLALNVNKGEVRELGILEIKSINSNAFSSLIDAKDEHKIQAQIYMTCLEEERQRIQKKCKTKAELTKYIKSKEFYNYYAPMYAHLKSGSKFTREEKIRFKIVQHRQICRMLWSVPRPISKMVFLYEDKNSQELKEFVVRWDDDRVKEIRDKFEYVNACIKKKKLPKREGTSKSCTTCRWCNFKLECWM